ncbi:glycerophosphodiester phosphodiesterase [Flavisolibacter tropicus]|uniref:Glycerophosphodiester phosphodiesterase n=1 Tax=Flavisolibacter tropicus TaxID=1492898 RepID=A0A172U2U0_9BACT|nr:glycerophosphodiester phosphodiesterase [Flavisolibacter tropicus]
MLFISYEGAAQKMHSLKVNSEKELHQFFRRTGKDIPIISGHRGGKFKDYPENSIEALAYTLQHTPAFFEVDPRLTKDSVVVLFHDATLDRTSTGKGKLSDYTWEEVKQLKLKDSEGNITPYRIPTLKEALLWAKGKTLLNLDKKDVPPEMIAKIIDENDAAAHVLLTVHNVKDARFYYEHNSNLMFSAHILKPESLQAFESSGIPWSNIMAYIGPNLTAENKMILDDLHARNVKCMIGTGPSNDKLKDPAERMSSYQELIAGGVDIIESDLPIDVAHALSKQTTKKSKRAKKG